MSVLTLLSLLVGLAGAIYLWLRKHYSYWADRNVPFEPPTFIFGNMKGLGRTVHFKDIDRRLYLSFKGTTPFMGFYSFFNKSAFILDLDLIKRILIKDFTYFADRGLFHNVRDDPLTGNLLFLDGEPWRVMRQKLSPVFSSGKIKFMFPTMVSVGDRLRETCADLIGSQASGNEMEIKDLCARFTTDVIGSCAFGLECNSLKDPTAEFRRMGRSVLEEPRQPVYVQAFMFSDPALARKLHLKNFTDEVSTFFMNAVRETVEYREKNNVRRNDFMDILIEMKAKKGDSNGISDWEDLSNGLTLEQVAAQAMVFFLAGFETSSTTMAFCIYELAMNPEIQEKLRSEILQVLERHGGEVTYDSIKEMIYLEKVLSETLRKYSILPHIVRQTVKDYPVPNSDVVFEKGIRITIPVDSIHHDPEYYPEPQRFDPERFAPDAIAARHPMAYLPFGDGPRNCIGMRFGKLQAQIGLISLLRQFKFSPSKQTQIPVRISKRVFLVGPEGGIYLRVEKR